MNKEDFTRVAVQIAETCLYANQQDVQFADQLRENDPKLAGMIEGVVKARRAVFDYIDERVELKPKRIERVQQLQRGNWIR